MVNGRTINGVNVTGLETLTNAPGGGGGGGVINVGNSGAPGSLTEFMSFASDAGSAQTVNNSGTFNVYARGTVPGALNFTGGGAGTTSNFNNAGGLINVQADGGATTNAVTLNTTALGGTSDLNYTYTWGAGTYNFNGGLSGGIPSRLAVDTFLGAPGSTSDRLVVGGNATSNTLVAVNDTNAGAGTLNLTGITVAAVQGTGSTNFQVDPASPNYVNFGPLGAIDKGFFVYPLIYTPGGATGLGNANGNAYKFYGVPGPFAFNLPVALTAAQNIFFETGLFWEDRLSETRSMFMHGIRTAGYAAGGGADLPVKAPVKVAEPTTEGGIWLKAMGSWTSRKTTADYGQLNPLLASLNLPNDYHQNIYGLIGGVDHGWWGLTSPQDAFVLEVMGGYIESNVTFDQANVLPGAGGTTTTRFDYTGGTVGVSGSYMNGGFFASALLKADFLNLKISGIPASFGVGNEQSVDSTTWGVLSDIGYRFEYGRFFLEPLLTLAYAQTRIGDLNLNGTGVTAQFGNGDSFRLAGGGRAGGTLMADAGHTLEASVTARIWDQVSGSNNVDFVNAGTPFTLTDSYTKTWGETDLQLDWFNRASGWSAFVKGGAKFNQDFLTGTAKGGMRYQW